MVPVPPPEWIIAPGSTVQVSEWLDPIVTCCAVAGAQLEVAEPVDILHERLAAYSPSERGCGEPSVFMTLRKITAAICAKRCGCEVLAFIVVGYTAQVADKSYRRFGSIGSCLVDRRSEVECFDIICRQVEACDLVLGGICLLCRETEQSLKLWLPVLML